MDNLIIEVGKYYKSRDGHKIRIYAIDGHSHYPIHGAILSNEGWEVETWGKDGFRLFPFWPDRECKSDIVSEWEEE